MYNIFLKEKQQQNTKINTLILSTVGELNCAHVQKFHLVYI